MRQPTTYRKDSIWDFMSEMERAFDDVWNAPLAGPPANRLSSGVFTPAVDLHESKDFYLVSMDVPGVSEKDIQIDVHEGRLTVSGERVRTQNEEDGGFKRYERSYGRFERSFALPQNVNKDSIQARFENGVLEVMIPKAEIAKSRSIQINKDKGGLFSRLLGQKDTHATAKSASDEKH